MFVSVPVVMFRDRLSGYVERQEHGGGPEQWHGGEPSVGEGRMHLGRLTNERGFPYSKWVVTRFQISFFPIPCASYQ